MKKHLLFLPVLLLAMVLASCGRSSSGSSTPMSSSNPPMSSSSTPVTPDEPEPIGYADGVYRGTYADIGGVEVAVEFTLRDGMIETFDLRGLNIDGVDYLGENIDEFAPEFAKKHTDLLESMVGLDLMDTLDNIFEPDGLLGSMMGLDDSAAAEDAASPRFEGGKVVSAIRDALNRGVYSMTADSGSMPDEEPSSSDAQSDVQDGSSSSALNSEASSDAALSSSESAAE